MSYKVLALKWRPNNFEDVIGQEHITQSLMNAIKLNRISHAFTFTGPRGVGKTTTARILAKELNEIDDLNSSFDVIEMDAASNRGIDEIRNLRENASVAPAHGKYKIYIIDEVHMLTKEAFNALLKTLEEPPEKVIFILATTDPYKIPATILSRTQRFDFRRLSDKNIIKQLKLVLEHENKSYDENSLNIIAQKSEGGMRDALGYLDQMLIYCNSSIKEEDVYSALGIVNNNLYLIIFNNIINSKTLNVMNLVKEIIDSGVSIKDFILGFNRFLRMLLLDVINNEVNEDLDLEKFNIKELDIVRFMELMMQFEAKSKFYSNPDSALEVFMIKLCSLDSIVNLSEIINNIGDNSNQDISNADKKFKAYSLNKPSVNSFDNKRKARNKVPSMINATSKVNDVIDSDSDSIKLVASSNKEESDNNTIVDLEQTPQLDDSSETVSQVENENKELTIENKVISPQDINQVDNDLESSYQVANENKEPTIDNKVDSYQTILSIIDKKNSKTAGFLENSKIDKIEGHDIHIKVDKVNNFVFNALLNDKSLIENSIKKVLGIKCSVLLQRGVVENNKENKNKNVVKDDEHPLFMDAINKFEGQIIK